MLRLKTRGIRWLKGFHLLAVSCWIGGAIALMMLYFIKGDLDNGGILYGINRSIHHIDMAVIVVPGAFGCLITGIIYSTFTSWGFFKHKWLIFKWIITVVAIIFGTFWLGPWETNMMEISRDLGISALSDPTYLYNERMNFFFGGVQCLILIITLFISIFKPWKKKKV
jgi:uncharacterized membrane protein